MTGTVENVSVDVDSSAIVESYQHARVRTPDVSAAEVAARRLLGLLIFTHLVTGCTFALAAGFTGEFLLFARFWVGVLLGATIYALMLLTHYAGELLEQRLDAS